MIIGRVHKCQRASSKDLVSYPAEAQQESTGFEQSARLALNRPSTCRYYLSGSDAFRLKLMLPLHPERLQHLRDEEMAAEQLKQLKLLAQTEAKPGSIRPGPVTDSQEP